ncbi:MAG: SM/Sec1-family protein [Monoraphidium minutum]|nr:MAG: SM/Sec1-family protein [Monoraphidium minutum]
MALNIRQKQCDALLRMLNLQSDRAPGGGGGGGGAPAGSELYKVLVLDKPCRDIIAPLLRVSDLRRAGVTLHLALEAERQPIADVPAVYLLQPTQKGADRVAADLAAGLYDSVHLNFSMAAPNRLLETIAAGALGSGNLGRVARVFDQYVSFVALEPGLFSLGLPGSYVELNDPAARDTQIEAAVSSIVDGLVSALVTLGSVPVIRCPRGGAAEHVASALEGRLRDLLKGRSNLFSEAAGAGGGGALAATLSRPLLVLFDRNFDLSVMLQHTWSYKPLVQDVLGLRLNRVTLGGPEPAAPGGPPGGPPLGQPQKKGYDVDERDFFWEACGSMPFPKVAEEVETQLQKYKASVDEINAKAAAGGQQHDEVVDHDEQLRRNTQHLMSAVSSLPELQERKKVLDKHTNLATALLGAIKGRGLDSLYNSEEEALSGKADAAAVVRLIQGPKGTPSDKLRLALVHVLAAEAPPGEGEVKELADALAAAGADTTALAYVARLRRNRLVGGRQGVSGQGGGAVAGGLGAAAGGGNLLDWADKALGQGISTMTRGVKNLLSGARQAPVAAALDALVEGRPGPEFESFAVFDPKLPPGRAGLERAKGPFREAVVFMIGGGNYLEREQLAAWAAGAGAGGRGPGGAVTGAIGGGGGAGGGGGGAGSRSVLYGATEMLSGEEFVAQLEELGRKGPL